MADDVLTSDDWTELADILALLTPLKQTSLFVQGAASPSPALRRRALVPLFALAPPAPSKKSCAQFGLNKQHVPKDGIHERTAPKVWTTSWDCSSVN